jgi:hypothetical protein
MACQRPPRGVGTPRALSASAICRSVVAPLRRISAMIGTTLPAARGIRVIQRRAYGLRNEDYLRLKILTCMLPAL